MPVAARDLKITAPLGWDLQIPRRFHANLKIGKPVGLKSEDFTQLISPR